MLKPKILLLPAVMSALIFTASAKAQVYTQNGGVALPTSRMVNTPPPPPNVYGGYMIGVGDILEIHVNDEESASGTYQVDQDGKVKLPLLSAPIPAAGSSTFELAGRLTDEFKRQQILRDPSVTVLIQRGLTQNVSILGAVQRPGTYPIEKPTSVVEVISMAGGLAPNAGNSLTITHTSPAPGGPAMVNASVKTGADPVSSINVTELMAGKQPNLNVRVNPGDVVTVSTAPVVFVVGAVVRPGAFTITEQRSEITVLQAVAMALGPSPIAKLSGAIIIRKSSSPSDREEIPIDLKKLMKGKNQDQTLQANDILFVPQSNLKAGLKRMGDIGTSAATSAAGYAIFAY